jgi:hypothetical protein
MAKVWSRESLIDGDVLEFGEALGSLISHPGYVWLIKTLREEAQSRIRRAGTTGVDGSPGQLIKHNQNVFSAEGMLAAEALVAEAIEQVKKKIHEKEE